MADEFWLNDRQWATIEPLLPQNQPGARRVDDRRVISGIIHALKSGCRWRDCPAVFGPYTTVYNRWNRWSRRKVWRNLFEALRCLSPDDDFQAIDSTTAKAYRAAAGGKGGRRPRQSAVPAAAGPQRSTPLASSTAEPSRLFPTTPPESASIHSTALHTSGVTSSSACFAGSRTGGALPRATTSSPETSYQPSASQPQSYGGLDRIRTLERYKNYNRRLPGR